MKFTLPWQSGSFPTRYAISATHVGGPGKPLDLASGAMLSNDGQMLEISLPGRISIGGLTLLRSSLQVLDDGSIYITYRR